MVFPSSACVTQAKIGLACPAFDVNAACTGFIYALDVATAIIESGRARTVLVIGADVLSSVIDYTDRSTCVLFGDGAGAVVMQASDEPGVLGVHLGADGSGVGLLYVPAGGSAAPMTAERLAAREGYLKMNGSEVFKFAVRMIPKVTKLALAESGLTTSDVDWLVPHQANQRITDTVAQRLGISHEHVVCRIEDTGNTSAASIPIVLDSLQRDGHLRPGNILALVGFGAGLTYGAAIIRWTRED
jgi:3-oxoacyl-[acyl-carrier-protein] synthase-3